MIKIYGNGETADSIRCQLYNKYTQCTFGVIYGSSKDCSRDDIFLNKNIFLDKYRALIILREAGVSVPQVFTEKDLLMSDFKGLLIGRDKNHSCGTDITIHKITHISSHDVLLKDNKARYYYVEMKAKVQEFRVHVLGEETICYEKTGGDKREVAWSYRNGFKFKKYDGVHKRAIEVLGVQTARALGYDFGAVDIILADDGKHYVLEINSAPRLSPTLVRMYAGYFEKEGVRHGTKSVAERVWQSVKGFLFDAREEEQSDTGHTQWTRQSV